MGHACVGRARATEQSLRHNTDNDAVKMVNTFRGCTREHLVRLMDRSGDLECRTSLELPARLAASSSWQIQRERAIPVRRSGLLRAGAL